MLECDSKLNSNFRLQCFVVSCMPYTITLQ